MKNKYIPTAAGLYLNYLIHGMGVLLITLNMAHLQEQWGNRRCWRIHRYLLVRYRQAGDHCDRLFVGSLWP